ncbi:hypothetical protein FCI58_08460, partial [Enterobacter hormaechei]|nr:hypothetical protein [Enterobacter hormaechei]
MDVVELVSAMEEKFGVSAAAAVAVAAGPAEAAEEKTEFDVILKAAGANKVAVSPCRWRMKALPGYISMGIFLTQTHGTSEWWPDDQLPG